VLAFLLKQDPNAASYLCNKGKNLLHLAVNDRDNEDDVFEAKVGFLSINHPMLLGQYNKKGLIPLHYYLCTINFPTTNIVVSSLMGNQQSIMQAGATGTENDADGDDEMNNHGSLPLHMLVKTRNSLPQSSPVSEIANVLRLLISRHPGAISVMNIHDKYPYNYAVEKNLNPYFIRILLRGDPALNPILLRNLNYTERRLAMFLAFVAVIRSTKVSIWASLQFDNKDLLKRVISFL
jgi:hypothetical protein